MKAKSIALIFLLLFLFTLISCGKSPLLMKKPAEEIQGQNALESERKFSTSAHQLSITWLSPINSTDVGHFLLISKKDKIASDLPVIPTVFLWMPSMGHGSSPVTIKKLGVGVYDISDVYFIMDGDWHIKIQLRMGSQILDELYFSYNL